MELLVVISIIALLIAMILPSFRAAKLDAERAKCLSNMGQMGRAIHAYEVNHKGFLPGPSWYGQTARYTTNTKNIAAHTAPYMGYPQPSSTSAINQMFICPSFYRVKPAGYAIENCVIYGAMSEKNAQGLRVFGYPAFNGAPEYAPDLLINVNDPSTAKAIRDIDVQLNGSAGWGAQTARSPAHGYSQFEATRNYVFFDTHAESIREVVP